MSGTQNLISYLGWTFLPHLATRFLQSLWYRLTIRVGDPAPQPGSPKHTKHKRRILMGVIIVYLLYTIFEADWNMRRDGDFYQALGVLPDVNDKELKSRFRRLTIQFHPDKIQNPADRQTAEAYFVHLRLAYDTLLDPVKRFAYDRFGPDMLEWKHCSSIGDYMFRGFQTLAPYYAAGGGFMIMMGVLGYFEWGRYWRHFFYGCLITFELYTVSRPYHSPMVTNFINPILMRFSTHAPLLPFQQLILARKLLITLFIAFSQLGALIQPPNQNSAVNSETKVHQQIDRLEHISKVTDVEATRLLALDMAPFAGDDQAIKDVRGRLQNWLVENTIRGDPEVRDAVGRVMTRRRPDAPAGARGTK